MEPIKILVRGASAMVVAAPEITVGLVGCPVEFTFDDSWDGLTKSALYRAGSVCRMDPDIENTSTVSAEVLEQEGMILEIGVLGMNADGTIVVPTVWVGVDQIQKGVSGEAQEAAQPELPVWMKVLAKLNAIIEGNLSIIPKDLIVVGDAQPEYGPVIWYNTGADMKGALCYVDENNEIHELMPRTSLDMVQGSEGIKAHMQNTANPHKVELEQLCKQGPLIFGPFQCGDAFPENPVEGQVFARRVIRNG